MLDLSLRAPGSPAAPAFAGEGAIHRGNLLLRDRPETLRDVEARFGLSSQGVQLREATGSLGGGRVQARGAVALNGWQLGGYRFKLQAQNVAVGQVEGFSSAWDADLELSGITREAQIEGRVRLVRGVYSRNLSIVSLVTAVGVLLVVRAASDQRALSAIKRQIHGDLFEIRLFNDDIRAMLRAQWALSVEAPRPGPWSSDRWRAVMAHRLPRPRLERRPTRSLCLADPRRLDPFLDVVATSRIAAYDVTMQITGPVSDVSVRFTSTPRLSQNDLLSLVAFGATGTGLRESPAPFCWARRASCSPRTCWASTPAWPGCASAPAPLAAAHRAPASPVRSDRRPSAPAQKRPGRERRCASVPAPGPPLPVRRYDRDGGCSADVVLLPLR